VIVAIGYYIVQWDIGIAAKFSLICLASFVATLAGYEAIQRFNPLRRLFGMKPLARRRARALGHRLKSHASEAPAG
jgi:hypothetical protein